MPKQGHRQEQMGEQMQQGMQGHEHEQRGRAEGGHIKSQSILLKHASPQAHQVITKANVRGKCHSGYSNVTAVIQTSSINANTETSSQAKNHNVTHHLITGKQHHGPGHILTGKRHSSHRHMQTSQANVAGKCRRQMSQANVPGWQDSQTVVTSRRRKQSSQATVVEYSEPWEHAIMTADSKVRLTTRHTCEV
jgi:hypothetical protein